MAYTHKYVTETQDVRFVRAETRGVMQIAGRLHAESMEDVPATAAILEAAFNTAGAAAVGKAFKGAASIAAEHMAGLLINARVLKSTFSSSKSIRTELREFYSSAISADNLLLAYPGAFLYARPTYREIYKDGKLFAR